MQNAIGQNVKMWGSSIIGFGLYHYKHESGHEGDRCRVSFALRKANFALYIKKGFKEGNSLLKKLGKYKTIKGCLYIKKLADIDAVVLEELSAQSVKYMKALYPQTVIKPKI